MITLPSTQTNVLHVLIENVLHLINKIWLFNWSIKSMNLAKGDNSNRPCVLIFQARRKTEVTRRVMTTSGDAVDSIYIHICHKPS